MVRFTGGSSNQDRINQRTLKSNAARAARNGDVSPGPVTSRMHRDGGSRNNTRFSSGRGDRPAGGRPGNYRG